MAREIWFNIGSCNHVLPNGTKLLSELILIYHQWVLRYSSEFNNTENAHESYFYKT